jgi:hypothetical protein
VLLGLLGGCGSATAATPTAASVPDAPADSVIIDFGSGPKVLKVEGASFSLLQSNFTIRASKDGAGDAPFVQLAVDRRALPGTLTCAEGGITMYVATTLETVYYAGADPDPCLARLEKWGPVGEPVVGRFSGTLRSGAGDEIEVVASFNVTRRADQ